MGIEQWRGRGWERGGGEAAMIFVYFALIHENRISIHGENKNQKKEKEHEQGNRLRDCVIHINMERVRKYVFN